MNDVDFCTDVIEDVSICLAVYKQDVIDLCRSRSRNVLQPVYKDVPPETSAPIKCTTATKRGKTSTPHIVHEQLQASSVPISKESGPGSLNQNGHNRALVGARLAQSHEKMASSYSGPGSARSSSSAGSSTTTVGSSWHVIGTSTSSLGTSSIGTESYSQRSRSSERGSDVSGQEASRSLPSRTSQHLHPDLPKTRVEETHLSDPDPRMGPEQEMCEDNNLVCSGETHSDGRMIRTSSTGDKSVEMKDMSSVSYDPDLDSEVFGLEQDPDRTIQEEASHNAQLPGTRDGSSLSQRAQVPSDPGSASAYLPCQGNPAPVNPGESSRNSCSESLGQDGASTYVPSTDATSGASAEGDKPWCATIILVPVRLGGDEVNPVYIRPIQSLFTLENCVGIIGGKPKHSLYFTGFQGE